MNSICIATYNGEKYIAEQLRSILTQIKEDDEVIISDDGSTDGTISIIEAIGDKRIQIYHHGKHNLILNFENALKRAKGDIVFLSDQDDVWLPGKYATCVDCLRDVDLVCTDSTVVDEELNVIHESFFKYYHSGAGIVKNIIVSTYFGSCMAFKRSLLSEALPFPRTSDMGHDLWLGLTAEIVGKVKFVDTPCILYRRHEGAFVNFNGNILNRSSRPLYAKIKTRIVIMYHIAVFAIRHWFVAKK